MVATVVAEEAASNIARKAAKQVSAESRSSFGSSDNRGGGRQNQTPVSLSGGCSSCSSSDSSLPLHSTHCHSSSISPSRQPRSQSRSLRQQFGAAGESPANQRNRTQDDRGRSRSPGQLHLPRRQGDSASTEEADSETSPRRSSSALA